MLLIEDDATSAAALRAILIRRGCEVLVAADLATAYLLFAEQPDSVVLDLMLPDGDGAEVLRRLRAFDGSWGQTVRVAVTTGVSDPDRLDAVRALRPNVLLRKPIDLVALLAGIGVT